MKLIKFTFKIMDSSSSSSSSSSSTTFDYKKVENVCFILLEMVQRNNQELIPNPHCYKIKIFY